MFKADKVLDCTGQVCPTTILKISKTMHEIGIGQLLKVITTDPGSSMDIESWVYQTGHELLADVQKGGAYVFYIRRMR